MILAHSIQMDVTEEQEGYFARACGAARFVWNWAMVEWEHQYKAGMKPTAMGLKKQFNAIKYQDFPWLKDIHRDAHAQPFAHLAKAWTAFFKDVKAGKKAHAPRFKKKGCARDSFYVANDKFRLDPGDSKRIPAFVVLPKVGRVPLREALRFEGRIKGAAVSRQADRWFLSVQVDVPNEQARRRRTGNGIVGVDLGITTAATLSTGEKIVGPRPLKSALRRLRIRSRRLSRKVEAARAWQKSFIGPLPAAKSRLPVTRKRQKCTLTLACLHRRVANLRSDFIHKLTSSLCRENQAIGIETLNVKGMLANDRLARAIADIGMGEFARQVTYKTALHDTLLTEADQWFPSSKRCHVCGHIHSGLTLSDREWDCPQCGSHHDRDENASQNLKQLAAAAQTGKALPVACPSGNGGTSSGIVPGVGGKVTTVRHEAGLQGASGRKENSAQIARLQ